MSTDAVRGTRHLDLEMTDGSGSTTIITTAHTLVLADVLHLYVAPECGHHIDNLNSSEPQLQRPTHRPNVNVPANRRLVDPNSSVTISEDDPNQPHIPTWS